MPTAISSNLPLYNTGPVVEWLDIAMQRIRRYPLDRYCQNVRVIQWKVQSTSTRLTAELGPWTLRSQASYP